MADTPKFFTVTLPDGAVHQLKDPTLNPIPSALVSGVSIGLKAPTTNIGTIFVGHDNTVSAANGFPIYPGGALTLDMQNGPNKLWVIGASGDKLNLVVMSG